MPLPSLQKCPVCRQAALPKFTPFCSARCADIDLGRWLTESYKVPTEEQPSPQHTTTANPEDED